MIFVCISCVYGFGIFLLFEFNDGGARWFDVIKFWLLLLGKFWFGCWKIANFALDTWFASDIYAHFKIRLQIYLSKTVKNPFLSSQIGFIHQIFFLTHHRHKFSLNSHTNPFKFYEAKLWNPKKDEIKILLIWSKKSCFIISQFRENR